MKRLELLDGGTSAFIGFVDCFVGTRISAPGHQATVGGRLQLAVSERPLAAALRQRGVFREADVGTTVR
jgi:hypothetical protein